MDDNFSVCVSRLEDVVHNHVLDSTVIDRLMVDLIRVVGEYGIAEIKDVRDTVNRTFMELFNNKEH
jgi:hypothetical protein